MQFDMATFYNGNNNNDEVGNERIKNKDHNENYCLLECQEELPRNDENDIRCENPSTTSLPRDGRISSCFYGTLRASWDGVIMEESRVLSNLLVIEDKFQTNSTSYFYFQDDLQPYMRKTVTSWMLDVFTEQKRDEGVFCLAVSLFDKFLYTKKTKKNQLQLVASVCMFLASKVKEPQPFEVSDLVAYTDNSITCDDLLGWEVLVLETLKWDVCLTTAHDFLDILLGHLPIDQSHRKIVIHHAETFVCLCITEHSFLVYPPSVLAAACLLASIHGLRLQIEANLVEVARSLQEITGIDIDCLKACQEQIEQLLHRLSASDFTSPNSMANHKLGPNAQPLCSSSTPTDVADISFG